MKASRSLSLVLAGLLTTAGLAACSSDSQGDEASSGDLTDVTLMLNWYPYGEHAPFYYGVEQDIFADHGINLTIEAGQGSTKTVQATGAGQVQFGWADTPAVLANIDKGVEVKSVGVFLQTTPSAVQVYTDAGIATPADLKGKTIAVSAGDAPTTTFPLYLEAAGLALDDVTQQNLDAAGKVSAMLTEQVDGLIGFAHDQGPTIAAKSGRDITYLRYSDVGLSFYSNGLITNDKLIASDPELVKAMVAATSEAFAAAAKDPEAAVGSMKGKDPQLPAQDVLLEQWKQTTNLLTTANTEGKAPGVNAPEDWTASLDILSSAGLVSGDKDASAYFDGSFAPGA